MTMAALSDAPPATDRALRRRQIFQFFAERVRKGEPVPALNHVADQLDMSYRTAIDIIRALTSDGVIVRQYRGGYQERWIVDGVGETPWVRLGKGGDLAGSEKREAPVIRKCMCCGNSFQSSHKHNRLCKHCGGA